MAATNRLTVREVEALKTPGLHADGGNLYLAVAPSGAKSWRFVYKLAGRRREMGLGRYGKAVDGGVTLAMARDAAQRHRLTLTAGSDPLAAPTAPEPVAPTVPTFGEVADSYVAAHRSGWRSPSHARGWERGITVDAAPLRPIPVDKITSGDVLAVLQPIWLAKSETASKLRGKIETVLDAAKARGLRSGENPAAWRGNLKHLLPAPLVLPHGHRAALPYPAIPTFVAKLQASSGMSARATEFTVATAARASEVLGARWDEIDVTTAIWTVPAHRMKGGRKEHRKPLSSHAMAIVNAAAEVRSSPFVFPGVKQGMPLSLTALEKAVARYGADTTPHGLRTSFRTWVAEATDFSFDVAEMQLAHEVGSGVERAYQRGELFDKRRAMMEAWAKYCVGNIA